MSHDEKSSRSVLHFVDYCGATWIDRYTFSVIVYPDVGHILSFDGRVVVFFVGNGVTT